MSAEENADELRRVHADRERMAQDRAISKLREENEALRRGLHVLAGVDADDLVGADLEKRTPTLAETPRSRHYHRASAVYDCRSRLIDALKRVPGDPYLSLILAQIEAAYEHLPKGAAQ